MKKLAALLLAAVMTTSLAACGSGDNDSSRDSESRSGGLSSILGGADSEDNGTTSRDNDTSSKDNDTTPTVNNSGSYIYADENGWGEGLVGDTMCTEWFNFTVNSVSSYGREYAGYSVYPGYRLLVVNVTIENTFGATIPMGDGDFTLFWDWDNLYGNYPVENAEDLSSDFLPGNYELAVGEKVTGDLLFEVPAYMTTLDFCYIEIDEDDEVHDAFAVTFFVDMYENGTGDYYVAEINDLISTYWFDYMVTSATLYSEYAGRTPSDGNQYLVLEMVMDNTYGVDIPMFVSDFDVEWDDPDGTSYEIPVGMTLNGEELMENSYSLPYGESVEATMVFEVSADYSEFFLYFDEEFADGALGNIYYIEFDF